MIFLYYNIFFEIRQGFPKKAYHFTRKFSLSPVSAPKGACGKLPQAPRNMFKSLCLHTDQETTNTGSSESIVPSSRRVPT